MRLLQRKGYANIVTRPHSMLDLTRQMEVEKFFQREKPEYVFLAAAKVGGILANDTYKAEFIYDNLMMAGNIIHSSYKYGAKKLLNLGSSCIYPKFAPQPMKEEFIMDGRLEPTNEPYAIAKISALKLCRYYNEQYRTNYLSVMPTNLYGYNDNFNLETAHAFPALIRKFHLAKLLKNNDVNGIRTDIRRYLLGFRFNNAAILKNEGSIKRSLEKIGITKDYVTLWGTGDVFREFLHVDDLAEACVYLIKNCNYKETGEIINIGTGTDLKIKKLGELIKEIVGFEGEIKYDISKPDGTPRKLLDVSKAKSLGWEAKISLQEGIRKTYDWYCNVRHE